jgi:hypothetical protein
MVIGVTIAAGELVLLGLRTADQDTVHFPDPQRFDITRIPNPHLTFGVRPTVLPRRAARAWNCAHCSWPCSTARLCGSPSRPTSCARGKTSSPAAWRRSP